MAIRTRTLSATDIVASPDTHGVWEGADSVGRSVQLAVGADGRAFGRGRILTQYGPGWSAWRETTAEQVTSIEVQATQGVWTWQEVEHTQMAWGAATLHRSGAKVRVPKA